MTDFQKFLASRRCFLTHSLSAGAAGLVAVAGLFLPRCQGAEQLTEEYITRILLPKIDAEKAYVKELAEWGTGSVTRQKVLYMALRFAGKKEKNSRFRYFLEAFPRFCASQGIKEYPRYKLVS